MTRTQGNNESYIESLHQEIFALQQQVLVLQPLQIEVEQLRQQVFTLRQQRLITSSGQSSSRQEFSLAERQARRDSYTNIGHFITETPDHAKPAKEKEKHPLNWAKAKPFMDNVPRNEDDWVVKRAQLGLDGSDGIIQLVDELTLRTMRPCPQTDDTDSAFTFSLGLYGETAASMLLEADRSVKTSRYRLLVFLALCCVSLEVGQPKEEVNRTMQQVLARLNGSRTASDRMFSRYLRAVKWVVSRADELFYRLEHRAFELFLHGRNLHLYTATRC
ncbi:hypothetical protein F4802DRAFT_104965 [Xylaria palmicola]|nr:hypothetical protein F4802DRAFT_104965 [Xylaria palmicola]